MPARLAQHLVDRGLLTETAMDAAQRHRATHGGSLDSALLELSAIAEPAILQAIADVSGLHPVNLADFEPNPEMARFIPANVAQRLGAVPLSEETGVLHVACNYPPPLRDLEDVSLLLGRKLQLWAAIEVRIQEWGAAIYGTPLSPRFGALIGTLEPKAGTSDRAAPSNVVVEEGSLEDALTHQMVEQIARAIAQEPILLEVKKRPPPVQEGIRDDPEPVRERERERVAAALEREEMVQLDSARARALREVAATPPSRTGPAPIEVPKPLAPLPTPAHEETEWSLDQARSALKGASRDRDHLIAATLRFARQTFGFTAAFAVVKGQAVLRGAMGESAEALGHRGLTIPLDASSVFRTVTMTRGTYVGPAPQDELTANSLAQMSRSPRTLFLYPVEVKNRVVCLFYGDSGSKPVSQRRLSEFLLFCQELPQAFGEVLMFRKQRFGTARAEPGFSFEENAPDRGRGQGLGWSPAVRGGAAAGPGARNHAFPQIQGMAPIRPPADFGPLLAKLTGPDTAARTSALAELSRTPEASARELARHFPGPTAWSRLPVTDLPDAEELGPIPMALSRLGRHGAQALAPLLDADDAEVRYYALLTSGSLHFPELMEGVLRGLFDYEPDIASAARAAATTLRRLPRFDSAMRDLRRELTGADPLRRSLAARTLGALHDRESIEGLINLTGSDDSLCAQSAAEALQVITRASHGMEQHKWLAWWAENRGRSRAEWLVAALRHGDVDVRLSAIEELARVMNDNLGYAAEASLVQREAAVGRWRAALAQEPRLKRIL